ncbi:cytochrome P450 [Sphingomonas ginsenosidimutans]|jgi:cytochrome P450|uniref:Cytochrome P450 n=2 Tax=Sphingomonas TaxID=13687 RepID=A0A2A4I0I5_9SPHN|nr:cytochrome P450 [Sphingomonas ginsenosidimutans]MEE2916172.1 cytochrome P450 [Pseudomonadota bacterium]PCG09435.1 cytochrome P450 [Sphingomonas ginsenosidimutans]
MATLAQDVTAPADPFDVSRPELYRDDTWHEPFRRLRAKAPVHKVVDSDFGPYWSVSTYKPIVEVESLPDLYSSEANGFTISRIAEDEVRMPMFIGRDRPIHTAQRRTVAPAFTPSEMVRLTQNIRDRSAEVLDTLPWNTAFDWVERVSIELTTQMLAILFDFPWEDRAKLTMWSDWMGDIELAKSEELRQQRLEKIYECGAYFQKLWAAKAGAAPTPDLISMMIHSDAMSHMDANEFMGNLILLIVGGNDTTRNTMSGLVYALDQFPAERAKLEADSTLIPNAVSEIIRWQTPLAHMARTAQQDTELMGQRIAAGDKVVMWYISANRDESVFGPNADDYQVDRPNARRHLAFGHGIHRCVGARLAELQVAILLEEMAKRRMRVNVTGAPDRVAACFVHGYRHLPVEISRY